MAVIHLHIPDSLAAEWEKKTGITITRCAEDAMTLFNWAVGEHVNGRVILSAEKDSGKITRLTTPLLESVPVKVSAFPEMFRPKR